MSRLSGLLAIVLVIVFPGVYALGQTVNATVSGVVTDPSGSVVSGAAVSLTNTDTNVSSQVRTNDEGFYRITGLLPGNYRAKVNMQGFKNTVKDGIELHVQDQVSLNFALQLGSASETITVTGGAPLVETESSSLGEIVLGRTVEEMPLNGRNVMNLTALVPGVVPQGGALSNPVGQNIYAWGNYAIGGGFANIGETIIDGAPITVAHSNLTTLVPTQDAIQEFKVQTNNLGSEYGQFSGGVINMTTKSGTNSFHGSVYEFLRNKVLNSKGYFAPTIPPYVQNQFGANVGGPIIKDKTFFFFGYEGYRQRQGETFVQGVPLPAMRGQVQPDGDADFSALCTTGFTGGVCNPAPPGSSASAVQIYDPVNGRTPFLNNIIPAARLDPTAKAMLGLWPEPNQSGLTNNFVTNASVGGNNDQYNARVDENISDRQKLFGRYTFWSGLNLPIDPFNNDTCEDRCTETWHTHQGVLADSYAFNAYTILDVRFSVLRFEYERTPQSLGIDLSQFGPNWAALQTANQFVYRTLPSICLENGPFGGSEGSVLCSSDGTGSTILQYNDLQTLAPTFTKIIHRHTIKVGADLRRYTDNYSQTNTPTGVYNFDNLTTASSSGTGGEAFASFMLGFPEASSAEQVIPVQSTKYYQGYFVADTFQATPRLTFNAGLRLDIPGSYTERKNRATVILPNVTNTVYPQFTGQIALVDSAERSSRHIQDPHYLFAPSAGFAFRVRQNTVVRGGYGLFYIPMDALLYVSPVDSIYTSAGSLTPGGIGPSTLSNPFPNGVRQPPGRSPDYQQSIVGTGFYNNVANDPWSYMEQWNLSVGQQIGKSASLEVGYAGSAGKKLTSPLFANLNALPTHDLSLGSQLFAPDSAPGLAIPYAGQALLPMPQFLGALFDGVDDLIKGRGSSTYNALQLTFRKRFEAAGTLMAAYTVSKTISNTEGETTWLESGSVFGGTLQDPNNAPAERSLSQYDVPQRAVISYVVDLPFGRGKRFLGNASGVAGNVVSGWGVNGITTFQRGFPLAFAASPNEASIFGFGLRPNVVSGCQKSTSGSAQSRLSEWFNTSCFTAPAAFTLGDESRADATLRSHGINNWDFAVFKNTNLTERVVLQFRSEFFNLFNRVQFGPPDTNCCTATNPDFGYVTSQLNNPRLIQFGLRLTF